MTDRKIIFKSYTVEEFLAIPKATLQAASEKERREREAAENSYYEELGKLVEENPIVNPRTIIRHRVRHELAESHPTASAPPAETKDK